jgi:hypothetical protein
MGGNVSDDPSVNSEQVSHHKTGLLVRVVSFVVTYGLWFITAALGGVDIFLLRGLLLKGVYLLEINPWAYAAIDKWGMVVFGLVWLVLTFIAEAGYQKAALKGFSKLLQFFAVITGIQVLFGGLVFLLTFVMR